MGNLIPFRRRKGYGRVLPTHRWQGVSRFRRLWFILRPWLFLAVLLLLWAVFDPVLVEPPRIFSGEPEKVSGQFTRCGPHRGTFCVVDGDTIKLGERKIRIIGIDAPEIYPPRCAEEARLGEAATAQLQRLLNQGDFVMIGRIGGAQDYYGRDLRALSRTRPDGSVQSIAEDMLASGQVRRYLGGLRGGWC
jgi:endonuclease YncB( thermonuclease family)